MTSPFQNSLVPLQKLEISSSEKMDDDEEVVVDGFGEGATGGSSSGAVVSSGGVEYKGLCAVSRRRTSRTLVGGNDQPSPDCGLQANASKRRAIMLVVAILWWRSAASLGQKRLQVKRARSLVH